MRLTIWPAIRDAYGFVFLHPGQFLRVVWLSLVLFALLQAAVPRLAEMLLPQSVGLYFLLTTLLYLAELAGGVVVAVILFRTILAGETSWLGGIRLGRRQLRFLGICVVIALAMIVPLFSVSQLLTPFIFPLLGAVANHHTYILVAVAAASYVVELAIWFVVGRMMLALPAAAIDQPEAFSWAGEPSAGVNAWKLLLGASVCWFPLNGLELLADRLLPVHAAVGRRFALAGGAAITTKQPWLLGDTVSFVFGLVEFGVALAFYAYAYRQLASGTPASENAA